MTVIFGWGRVREKNLGKAAVMKCGECSRQGDWDLIEVNKYFTLFFVPILAYEKKYFLFCQSCRKNSTQIFGDDIKSAKEKNKLYKDFASGKIDETQLNEGLSQIYTKYIGELSDKWECPDCHEENLNTSYRCVKCGYKIM